MTQACVIAISVLCKWSVGGLIMADLLLELFSEEIPARMQSRASNDLRRLVTDGLINAGLSYEDAKSFSTPRRLTLVVEGLPLVSPDISDERKGPRVGAPDKAIEGFLRTAGLPSIDACKMRDDGKGLYYFAEINKPGHAAPDIIAEVLEQVVRGFPWPKSMRWGNGQLRWVRPLHSIVATFGSKTEKPDVVPIEIDGIKAGNTTFGHRMMAGGAITVARFDDYAVKLEAAKVEIDCERRRETILADSKSLALAQGLELMDDPDLADEVAGLVEWPVALIGSFDMAFLELPPEVLTTSMRVNQKYFALKQAESGEMANKFIVIANIEARDGGTEIVSGNERVLAARLHDARFFWDQDLKIPLTAYGEKLGAVTYHEKLGTQGQRVDRIVRLAGELAPIVGADRDISARAAQLSKADLLCGMVGEFPELQGVMGCHYALKQGEPEAVANAIRDHYRPQGPSDSVPKAPTSISVALADKLDILVGFWAIDEKPTGSKDPFALRRAALGVIRIILENELRILLWPTFVVLGRRAVAQLLSGPRDKVEKQLVPFQISGDVNQESLNAQLTEVAGVAAELMSGKLKFSVPVQEWELEKSNNLLSFFADRLKGYLRETGARHDLIDAVFSLGSQDDLVMIVRRVEALGAFLQTDDGANLTVGIKRAQNILRIEEKKDGDEAFSGMPDPELLSLEAEKLLFEAVGTASEDVAAAINAENFGDAMRALAKLRTPVDLFFDDVIVNDEDRVLRTNRLKLMSLIRTATHAIADFSKIEG